MLIQWNFLSRLAASIRN